MNWRRTTGWIAIAAAATVLLAGGCDDGTLTPSDGTLLMSASPTRVVIDLLELEPNGTSRISAQLFNASELPLKDAVVNFSTDGGAMASQTNLCLSGSCSLSADACARDRDCPTAEPRPVLTDENGFARDTLKLKFSDPGSVTVVATSGSLTQSVDVEAVVPVLDAVLTADPPNEAQNGARVTFSGRSSATSEAAISCYVFVLDDGTSTQVEANQTGEWEFSQLGTRGATTTTTYDVALSVTDDPTTICGPTACGTDGLSCPTGWAGPDTLSYQTVCSVDPPVAAIEEDSRNATTKTITVRDASSTGDTAITGREWDCGDGNGFSDGLVAQTCDYDDADTTSKTIRLRISTACGVIQPEATYTVTFTSVP